MLLQEIRIDGPRSVGRKPGNILQALIGDVLLEVERQARLDHTGQVPQLVKQDRRLYDVGHAG